METIRNAMTVDVEDYFQVSAFENVISRDDWDALDCRVERNTTRILDLFSATDLSATFFVLGWVAERFPALVREISARGHEVASHGYSHVRATEQTQAEFGADIRKTKMLLEDITGVAVTGYRAASFSIASTNLWAHDELADAGHLYSSSIYPVRHDLYGMPAAPRFAFRVAESGILEVPITTVDAAGRNLPCGGGGYFRLLPYAYAHWGISRVNSRERQPTVFYFHPWEIDPGQPRQSPISMKTRVRHYTNLSRMEAKLKRLCQAFSWGRMDQVFLAPLSQNAPATVALRPAA